MLRVWIGVVILLIGFLIRVDDLGVRPLWIDEGFSYFAVREPDLLTVLARDVHPPLYFAALKAWAGVTGTSEFALRYFSLLFGLLNIALIAPLAREVARLRGITDPIVPLIAALLMAVAEMEFYTAQEVRSYTLHITCAIVSMWGFLRWLRTGERFAWTLWLIGMTALIYTHYLGIWTGIVQGLYALLFLRGRARITTIGSLLIPAALFSIWLFTIVLPYQTVKADSDATMDPSTIATLFAYIQDYLTGQWALMLGLLILGGLEFRDGRFYPRLGRGVWLLLLWIVVPIALTFIGNLQFSILTNYRISLVTVPLVLFWALGINTFRGQARAFLIAVIALYGIVNVDFQRVELPWDQFASLVTDYAQPDDLVMIDMKGVDFSLEYYLERQRAPGVAIVSLRQYVEWDQSAIHTELIPLLNVSPTVWVARWNDMPTGLDLIAPGYVQTAYQTIDYRGNQLEAYRFDRIPSDQPVIRFQNGMILRQFRAYHDPLRVDLWWSADQAMTRSYTVSAVLLDAEGRLVAQHDALPFLNQRPTDTWPNGALIYDPKPLTALDPIPSGEYQIGIVVYFWTQTGRLRRVLTETGSDMAILETFIRE